MVLTDERVVLIKGTLKTRSTQRSRFGNPLSASSNTKNSSKSPPPQPEPYCSYFASSFVCYLSLGMLESAAADLLDVLSKS